VKAKTAMAESQPLFLQKSLIRACSQAGALGETPKISPAWFRERAKTTAAIFQIREGQAEKRHSSVVPPWHAFGSGVVDMSPTCFQPHQQGERRKSRSKKTYGLAVNSADRIEL
jgi:hypothetical protein